jgi:hypothetical protein
LYKVRIYKFDIHVPKYYAKVEHSFLHIPSFPFHYYDSIEMSGSSYLLSALSQLDLYSYIDFPLTTRILARPQPKFETFYASMDTSSVEIKS